MSNLYVCADLHLGHKKILEFEPSRAVFSCIEEHDLIIQENWNRTVTKRDTVLVCGDIAFSRDAFNKFGSFNGRKILIQGNHDKYNVKEYLKYFQDVCSYVIKNRVIFTHIPIHHSQLEERWDYNIHGHLHSKTLDDPRYICCSLERIGFEPILVSKLLPDVFQT